MRGSRLHAVASHYTAHAMHGSRWWARQARVGWLYSAALGHTAASPPCSTKKYALLPATRRRPSASRSQPTSWGRRGGEGGGGWPLKNI